MKYLITKTKHIGLIIIVLAVLVANNLFAQTGPGGVGTIDGTSSLVLWLNADAEAGTDGTTSTSWADRSGFGNNFTAGTGATFNAGARNGFSTFSFDGSSNYFETPLNGALNPAQFTVFSSSQVNSSDSYKALISNRDNPPEAGFILYARPSGDSDNWDFWAGTSTTWSKAGNVTATVGAWSSQTLSYQSGTNGQKLYIDNNLDAQRTSTLTQNTARPTRIGAGRNESAADFFFSGNIGEVIMFNNVLNTAQIIIVNNYLSAKYNFANTANDLYTMDDPSNGDFDHDVVGIGRADVSNMHTEAMSSSILQVQNASGLDVDGEYLFWGHDAADATTWTTTEAPNAGVDVQRIAREWRLNEVGGDVGTIDFVIDPAALPALPGGLSTYALLVDSDGDFSDATPYLMTLSGANYTVVGMDIADGDYVTVAALNPVIDHTLLESNGTESVTSPMIEVSINFMATTDISVNYTTADGTALAAQPDYTAVAGGTLTIPSGSTTNTYSLTVIDDAVIESDEDFTITLSSPSAGVNLGPNTTHAYTINDDDNTRKIYFSSSSTDGIESGDGGTIVAISSSDPANPVTVDYTVIGGTATSVDDYTLPLTGTITFAPGSPTLQVFIIPLVNDLLKEPNETIIFRLSNPVNCNLDVDNTLGFIESTFIILDNDPDPTIQFNTTASSGVESVSPVSFQVDLSTISGADTDVTYTVTGGSATGGGVDYTLVTGMLTIPAGSLSGNVSAEIISDGIEEFDETIEITLSLPVNATLGTNTVHTYTITDNSANLGHLGPGGVGNVDGASALVLWLDANIETGGSSWNDQSGFGHNFTAGTGATFNAGARNGFSTFGFDGSSNYFETPLSGALNPAQFTVFSTSQVNSSGSYKALISNRDDPPEAGFILYARPSGDSDNWDFWAGTSSTWIKAGNVTATVGAWSSQTLSYQSGTNGQKLYVDNNLDAQRTSTLTQNTARPTRIGAGKNETAADFFFSGDIGEVIMYSAVLNTARRNIVNNYLSAKYDFALTTDDLYTMDDPGNGDFDYEVAGIGRDNAGGFHVDAQGTGMIRVNNPSDLGDGEYLFWGHDNGSFDMANTTDIPPGTINNRLNRIWRFDETGDVGTVSISFDVSAFTINDSNELVLLVDGDDGLMVNSAETVISSFSGGVATFTGVDITAGNWYTIASRTPDNVLPVELISFTAASENKTVALDWKTASEIDNDFFSVERSSNGVDFFEIGQVEGNGTTNELQDYDFIDKSPVHGISYYRLRQVDFDGAFEYSNVVSVNVLATNFAFNVYPNPIENHRAIIEMQNVGEGDTSIKVYNSIGKVVLNKTVALNPNQSLKYDLKFERNTPTGIYIVEVQSGQNRYIRKVVIQ